VSLIKWSINIFWVTFISWNSSMESSKGVFNDIWKLVYVNNNNKWRSYYNALLNPILSSLSWQRLSIKEKIGAACLPSSRRDSRTSKEEQRENQRNIKKKRRACGAAPAGFDIRCGWIDRKIQKKGGKRLRPVMAFKWFQRVLLLLLVWTPFLPRAFESLT